MLGIWHRAVGWELSRVFLLALAAITALILLGGVIAEATRQGLGLWQIVLAIPLLVPNFLPYTVPATTLFTVCIVYGRLAQDNEIQAIKSAGAHMAVVLKPALLLGVATTAIMFYLFIEIIPLSQWTLKTTITSNLKDTLFTVLRKERALRFPQLPYEIDCRDVVDGKLRDVTIKERSKTKANDIKMITFAREADMIISESRKEITINLVHFRLENIEKGEILSGPQQSLTIQLPDNFGQLIKMRAADMTWSELFEKRDMFAEEINRIELDLTHHVNQATPDSQANAKKLSEEIRFRRGIINGIQTEMNLRPAFAVGCLCFVLIGCPVGIWLSRGDYLSAFVSCFLPIVFVYYPIMLATINFARSGKMPYGSGLVWCADGVLLLVSVVLMRWLARR